VRVFQGENPLATKNIEIGEFEVQGLDENAPPDSEILITFSLDANGILQASATEKATGLARSITIDRVFGLDDEEQLSASRTRIQALLGKKDEDDAPKGSQSQPPKEVEPDANERAAALLQRAHMVLDDQGDHEDDESL